MTIFKESEMIIKAVLEHKDVFTNKKRTSSPSQENPLKQMFHHNFILKYRSKNISAYDDDALVITTEIASHPLLKNEQRRPSIIERVFTSTKSHL